jgi:hypothetical protein
MSVCSIRLPVVKMQQNCQTLWTARFDSKEGG